MDINNEFDNWEDLDLRFNWVTIDEDGDCYAHAAIRPILCEDEGNCNFWISRSHGDFTKLHRDLKFIKNYTNYSGNWELSLQERPIVNIKELYVFDWFDFNNGVIGISSINQKYKFFAIDKDGKGFVYLIKPELLNANWGSIKLPDNNPAYHYVGSKFPKGNWKLSLQERPIVTTNRKEIEMAIDIIQKEPFVFNWLYEDGTLIEVEYCWFTINANGVGILHKNKPKCKNKKGFWKSDKFAFQSNYKTLFDATNWQNSKIQRCVTLDNKVMSITTESGLVKSIEYDTNCKLFVMSEFYQSLEYKTAFKKYFNNK